MLENYKKHTNGLVEQIDKNVIVYDNKYSDKYNNYGELSNYISYLRLGYIIGTIGNIPSSLLDVGYGNGSFLKTCSNIIPKLYGSDTDYHYDLPNGIKYITDIYEKHYDVITFFDVLEHFENIYEIEKIKCTYICISVPNCHSPENDEWFFNWKHRRKDEHLWHFNKESLINFMTEIGYTLLNISNIEDTIRKNADEEINILTAIFKKND